MEQMLLSWVELKSVCWPFVSKQVPSYWIQIWTAQDPELISGKGVWREFQTPVSWMEVIRQLQLLRMEQQAKQNLLANTNVKHR
jgi:hypothetical protein